MTPLLPALLPAALPGLLASLLAAAGPDAASPQGQLAGAWLAPNGAQVDLATEGGRIVGRLGPQTGPCPLPAKTEVLRGSLLDDSVSAEVRLCLVAPGCGADEGRAIAILLVTKQLTGGVHSKASCASEVRSLVLRRAQTAGPPDGLDKPLRGDETPVGQIPNRPIGGPHPDGYDPRDARAAASVHGKVSELLRKGQARLGTGQFEQARKLFQQAVRQEPSRPEAYNGVGVTYYGRQDYAEALAWYKRALEADPRFGDAFYNMACVYALQEKKALAFRYLRLAALHRYAERRQLEADPDLETLRGDPEMAEILSLFPPQTGDRR
jgi:hypothetical protein